MISEGLAYGIFFVCFVGFIPCLIWTLAERHPLGAIGLVLTVAVGTTVIISNRNANGRVKAIQPKYYAVQEVGTVEAPVDVSVAGKQTINITELFHVVLYNPELYYLEVQEYVTPCDGWCLVTIYKQPTYRIVPRSLIEVQ